MAEHQQQQQQHYDDGPEVALQSYPEAIPPPPSQSPSHAYSLTTTQPPGSAGGYPSPAYAASKPEDGGYMSATAASVGGVGMSPGAAGSSPGFQQYPTHYYNPLAGQETPQVAANGTPTTDDDVRKGRERWSDRRGPMGCNCLVFAMSTVIAFLAAAVIGLAAGTGHEAHRASEALASLSSLQASVSSAAATPTATSFASIDMNCSIQPDTVSGTKYTAFQYLGQQTFTIHCNKDAGGVPLMSLFTEDLAMCMDACSAYSKALHKTFNVTNTNTTCGAVSFIPLWTNKKNATSNKAPGNCYLKPSPTNTNLPDPSISAEVHAAVVAT